MITYEQQLGANLTWAFQEGSMHFDQNSKVFAAMRKVTSRLNALGVPHVVVGGLAMFLHGYRRFTEDVDLLVTRESLARIHEELEGRGYLPPFTGSRHLRDAEFGVKIEFLVAGEYPGDGKPKPVSFPDPDSAGTELEGHRVLSLAKLIELKLASGMTNTGRAKDIGDVQEMIRALKLSEDFAEQLDPFVRDKYLELWQALVSSPDLPQ